MKKCGIYFCLKNGVVVYIGQTIDLVNRMSFHNSQLLDYDAMRFIPCIKENLEYYETRWIQRFKPAENHTHKGRKKYYYYTKKERPNGKATVFNANNYKMKFRVMTEKSIVGFGRFTDQTIGQLITRTENTKTRG